jgi:hypothetical protein
MMMAECGMKKESPSPLFIIHHSSFIIAFQKAHL